MDVMVMNFSNIYESEPSLSVFPWVTCSDLYGTNCYCTKESEVEIKKRIEKFPPEGIHLIDSGNYHYITKFWLDKINRPFDLLYFDFHPDLHEANFGDMLSCGSWVKKVIESNQFLNNVIAIGVNPLLVDEIPKDLRRKVSFLDGVDNLREILKLEQRDIYISIDKDVFSQELVATNWDQGSMQFKEFKQMLEMIFRYRSVIGIDICGEWENTSCYYENIRNTAMNHKFNQRLIQLINRLISVQRERDKEV